MAPHDLDRSRTAFDLDRARAMHRTMLRIRAFEQAALDAHAAGLVPGIIHVSIGQEAVAAGVCAHLRVEDCLASTHRGHGHAIAKGSDPRRMMAEIFGRADGTCGGKGGSMHIADFSVGMLGANGVVAGGIPIAVGAAQGLRLLGRDAVSVCFFGDGATNRGPFLEGLNWAALFRLPVLFVCEDNQVAAYTATDSVTAGPGPAARAEACGVPAESVDGNDALAVERVAARLLAAVRAGQGPRFLHARTYRLLGHTMSDPAGWRDPADVEAARTREPIGRLRAGLLAAGIPKAELDADEADALAEMAEARAFAEASPPPDPAQHLADVQDIGAPA